MPLRVHAQNGAEGGVHLRVHQDYRFSEPESLQDDLGSELDGPRHVDEDVDLRGTADHEWIVGDSGDAAPDGVVQPALAAG